MEKVNPNHILPDITPGDFPGLVSFWNFQEDGEDFGTTQGESYTLRSQSGPLSVHEDPTAPLGGKALQIKRGQWMNIARKDCPLLDFHGPDGHLTVIAWIKRKKTEHRNCEFIAGQWNESDGGRQYGLFLNISVWQQQDQVCGHLSNVGGPTPGYRYCIDGPVGATPVGFDEWSVVAMTYDGTQGFCWLNGHLDVRPQLNPYSMAGGLFDGGSQGSDFTVGAVDRSGEIGNFFSGEMAGLAVYRRALSPAEIFALSQL
ncbi:LamG domain-containing protein [Puniceicoccus vermicola]|uniref:LamG domain-containing protein n=1 Tax=Puniceicoccus vermicola TaxID=388746 RepID=A0A7X1E4D2_9BACT|nr:LamG domain-containing protein [Puniceicoccus vermicola]MBC2600487.1 LamG domain-containing protein [Puniceicoccus vermicola]